MKRWIATRSEFAKLLGVTPDRVTKLIAEGLPVAKTGSGRGHQTLIALGDALPWLMQRKVGDAEKSRDLRLAGDLKEEELRKRRGLVIEVAQVEQRWALMVAAARERYLSLPGIAVQRQLVRPEDEEALIALVDEALSELAARGVDAPAKSA